MGQPRPLFVYFLSFSNANSTKKTVGFSGIRTRIVWVEGEHADPLTTTTADSSTFWRKKNLKKLLGRFQGRRVGGFHRKVRGSVLGLHPRGQRAARGCRLWTTAARCTCKVEILLLHSFNQKKKIGSKQSNRWPHYVHRMSFFGVIIPWQFDLTVLSIKSN